MASIIRFITNALPPNRRINEFPSEPERPEKTIKKNQLELLCFHGRHRMIKLVFLIFQFLCFAPNNISENQGCSSLPAIPQKRIEDDFRQTFQTGEIRFTVWTSKTISFLWCPSFRRCSCWRCNWPTDWFHRRKSFSPAGADDRPPGIPTYPSIG